MGLHPYVAHGLELLRRTHVRFRVTSGVRGITEQTRLYRDFLAGRRRYPVAPPGTSTHNYGLAFDAVALDPSTQAELVAVAQEMGFVWAGPRDPVHFQVVSQADWSTALRRSPGAPLRALA